MSCATRSRWYVASPKVNSDDLARLKYRCRSCSHVKPMPPWSWIPVADTLRYASEAPLAVTMTKTRSEEHTSELQSHHDLVCRLLLEKKKENAPEATRAAPMA